MKENCYILMLEDDPDDRFIAETTLQELGYTTQITFVKSSDELFSHLESHRKPFLILLDFNSSPMSAVEILKDLKSNDHYKHIPVVVLSESPSQSDITECYANGASSYVIKPVSLADTRNKINTFFEYWLSVVEV
jgi:CheY-like chemotaxis protein